MNETEAEIRAALVVCEWQANRETTAGLGHRVAVALLCADREATERAVKAICPYCAAGLPPPPGKPKSMVHKTATGWAQCKAREIRQVEAGV